MQIKRTSESLPGAAKAAGLSRDQRVTALRHPLSHMVHRIALTLTLLLLATDAYAWPEARCKELEALPGISCPAADDYDTTSMGLSGNCDGCTANPGNSTGAPSFGNAWQFYSNAQPVAVDEVNMPPGNTVSKVWEANPPSAANMTFAFNLDADDFVVGNGTRRICARHYFRLTNGWFSNNHIGGKFMEMTFSGSPTGVGHAYQIQMGSNGSGTATSDYSWAAPSGWGGAYPATNIPVADDSLELDDCLDHWVRQEMCISGPFDTGAGDFIVEGYAKCLGGPSAGVQHVWQRTNLGRPPSGWNTSAYGGNFRVINGARDHLCSPGPCQGVRQESHAMLATWTSEALGQFIGPAVEVEGGNPAPPPPRRPAAPIRSSASRAPRRTRTRSARWLDGAGWAQPAHLVLPPLERPVSPAALTRGPLISLSPSDPSYPKR